MEIIRNILIILLLALNSPAFATDYFVNSSKGDDHKNDGLSPTSPWRTIEKVNSAFTIFKPGDRILFKRGDIFKGTLIISNSGIACNPIIIGAYGEGDRPIITSFTDLTTWTSEGVNIYSTSLSVESNQIVGYRGFKRIMVTVDGEVKWMGRWPDRGYRNMDSVKGNDEFADNTLEKDLKNELGLRVGDIIGAEAVMRIQPWRLWRSRIADHSKKRIKVNQMVSNPSELIPLFADYGYFLQDHRSFLTNHGDWYYDEAQGKLFMFLDSAPFNYTIKAATRNHLVTFIGKCDYITIENLAFHGSNSDNFYKSLWPKGYNKSDYLTIQNLDINYSGGIGIFIGGAEHGTIKDNIINNSLGGGLRLRLSNDFTVIRNEIYNSAIIRGTSNIYDGVYLLGDNILFQHNQVISSGRNGIWFRGNSSEVRNNLIKYSGLLLNDNGGIYTHGSWSPAVTGLVIDGNIILNAYGNYEGVPASHASSYACGIYTDENASNIKITNNVMAYNGWSGYVAHKTLDCLIDNNLMFANGLRQAYFYDSRSTSKPEPEITFSNNILIGLDEEKELVLVRSHYKNPHFFKEIDNNYYLRHNNTNGIFRKREPDPVGIENFSLNKWQTYVGGDANSKTLSIDYRSVFFEYNGTNEYRVIKLDKPMKDVKGAEYFNSVTLPPYTAIVLVLKPDTEKSASE